LYTLCIGLPRVDCRLPKVLGLMYSASIMIPILYVQFHSSKVQVKSNIVSFYAVSLFSFTLKF